MVTAGEDQFGANFRLILDADNLLKKLQNSSKPAWTAAPGPPVAPDGATTGGISRVL